MTSSNQTIKKLTSVCSIRVIQHVQWNQPHCMNSEIKVTCLHWLGELVYSNCFWADLIEKVGGHYWYTWFSMEAYKYVLMHSYPNLQALYSLLIHTCTYLHCTVSKPQVTQLTEINNQVVTYVPEWDID